MQAVLEGRCALGILPTGGGKSLCFQLPALFLPKLVVVVSPLIALMRDQTSRLEKREVAAAKLDSTLTADEEREALSEIRRAKAEIVYVTPERLEREDTLAMFAKAGVSLLVVDEAHCVSQWGHDFRPAFLALRDARRSLGNPPLLALTATATPEIERDILAQLDIRHAEVVRADIRRKNIFLDVRRTASEKAKRDALVALLADAGSTPAIVYAATIKIVEEVFNFLAARGTRVTRYHGRLGAKARAEQQEAFMEGRADVMVATSAFGMGIDKADVRLVVHVTFPDSLETYYQEAGRGGRDGKPARAVLLFRWEDRRVQAFFLGGKYPSPADFRRTWRALTELSATGDALVAWRALAAKSELPERAVKVIVAQLDAMGVAARSPRGIQPLRSFRDDEELTAFVISYEERFITDRQKLEQMIGYAQARRCRGNTILDYFGDAPADACQHCDVCRDGPMVAPAEEVDVPIEVGSAATPAVTRFVPGDLVRHQRFGVGVVTLRAGDKVTVDFERVGGKTVRAAFLQAGPKPAGLP